MRYADGVLIKALTEVLIGVLIRVLIGVLMKALTEVLIEVLMRGADLGAYEER